MVSMDSTPPVAINTTGENVSKPTDMDGLGQSSFQNIGTSSNSAGSSAFDMHSLSHSIEETNPFRQIQAHRTGQSTDSQSHSVASGTLIGFCLSGL